MRLFILTTVTMMFFAANSVLNRAALADGLIGPASFAALRLGFGAIVLILILWLKGDFKSGFNIKPRLDAVIGLILYVICFSFAYTVLEAGLGSLLLFGMVQITMFGGAVIQGNKPSPLQWLGAVIGMSGLGYVMNPSTSGVDLTGAIIMAVAGFGWGVYSLAGKKVDQALTSTAASFIWATPVVLIIWWVASPEAFSAEGVLLAFLSGSLASGLGYVLWFMVLPELQTETAATVQLSVPLIAMLGGIVFLDEVWTLDFTIASSLVLGGIALSLRSAKKPVNTR